MQWFGEPTLVAVVQLATLPNHTYSQMDSKLGLSDAATSRISVGGFASHIPIGDSGAELRPTWENIIKNVKCKRFLSVHRCSPFTPEPPVQDVGATPDTNAGCVCDEGEGSKHTPSGLSSRYLPSPVRVPCHFIQGSTDCLGITFGSVFR